MKQLLFGLSIFFSTVTFSQSRSSLFFELGGPADVSINYDVRFPKKNDGFGTRIGLGGFSYSTDAKIVKGFAIPVELNYHFELSERKFLESGAGMVYKKITYDNKNQPVDSSSSDASPYIDFAIRFISANNKMIYRIAFTPKFIDDKIITWGGLSIGIRF